MNDPSVTTVDSNAAASGPRRKYTSVIYFHGMGSQRRYEEVSRLVDALDKNASRHNKETGLIRDIRAALEPHREHQEEDIAYIRCTRIGRGRSEYVRFYEAYWAPLTAGGVPSMQVLVWLLKQLPHPVRALLTPWRLRARLHRASLHRLWQTLQQKPHMEYSFDDFRRLLKLYDNFEGPRAWGTFPRGSFKDFVQFVKDEEPDGERRERLIRFSRRWWRDFCFHEISYELILLTIALAALLAGVAACFAVIFAMRLMVAFVQGSPLAVRVSGLIQPTFKNISAVLVALASITGISRFLRDYLGDVQVWATYQETDTKFKQRNEILCYSRDLMRHVLRDENCERAVIVAHSLGTTVAFDTLLALGRRERAGPAAALPIEKISHFISMGSPVDKIHYFFESYRGKYHRYNRVVEEIRGDIGSSPFARNRKPQIHWINFFDRADLVAGSLHSPANRGLAELQVDNVEVANLRFPAPGRSHSAYFENPDVLQTTFDVIFDDKFSFLSAPLVKGVGRDYVSQKVPPGRALRRTRIFQTFMLLIPWITLAAVISGVMGLRAPAEWLEDADLALVAIIVTGWISLGRGGPHLGAASPLSEQKEERNDVTQEAESQ